MGQHLPLPERIPIPNETLANKMIEMGFFIDKPVNNEKYVTYTMPTGWSLKNHSWREDLPIFYFVDNNNVARVSVTGSWKETYDNSLYIKLVSEPFDYKPRDQEIIPSETSAPAILSKVADALTKPYLIDSDDV